MSDRNNKRMMELFKIPGNDICADCGSKTPEWTSYDYGVFICTTCASYHRNIRAKVKSLKLATFDDDEIELLESMGNLAAQKKYERHVPTCYRRPKHGDPQILIEQWIRAKYERKEFIHVDKQVYTRDHMEGLLDVKKKKVLYSRKFILSEKDNTFTYFHNGESSDSKTTTPLSELNACLSPYKMEKENNGKCMQFSYLYEGSTKHIFVSHKSAEVLIQWYMAIRSAKLNRLMVAYPSANEIDFVPRLTQDFAMEGWLSKTGPSASDSYRKRWFTLDDRKLMYHLQALDESPRGEIFIGDSSSGYSIDEGAPAGCKEMGFSFSLLTPERTFVLSSATSDERRRWMEAIVAVLGRSLLPQDNKCKSSMDQAKGQARRSWFK